MDKIIHASLLLVILGISTVYAQDPTVRITQTDPPSVGVVVTAIRDRDLTMDCYVENLLANAAVRWQRITTDSTGKEETKGISQDMAMDDNIHYSMEKPTQFTWRLRVRGIQVSDEGSYMCYVQVTLNSKVFANRTVTVVYPPFMDPAQTSSDTSVKFGEDLDLICNATGRPEPLIEWSRLGGTLLPIGQEKFKGMVLKLTNIQAKDRGIYRCTAINKVATVKHDVNLGVRFPPVITVVRTVVSQAIGYRAELQCAVEANPLPDADTQVAWSRGSTTYTQSSPRYEVRFLQGAFSRLSYELILYSVRQEDYGTYTCNVVNIHGQASGQVVLQQTQTPQPSVKLGRVVSGNERPDASAVCTRSTLLLTLLTAILAMLLG